MKLSKIVQLKDEQYAEDRTPISVIDENHARTTFESMVVDGHCILVDEAGVLTNCSSLLYALTLDRIWLPKLLARDDVWIRDVPNATQPELRKFADVWIPRQYAIRGYLLAGLCTDRVQKSTMHGPKGRTEILDERRSEAEIGRRRVARLFIMQRSIPNDSTIIHTCNTTWSR